RPRRRSSRASPSRAGSAMRTASPSASRRSPASRPRPATPRARRRSSARATQHARRSERGGSPTTRSSTSAGSPGRSRSSTRTRTRSATRTAASSRSRTPPRSRSLPPPRSPRRQRIPRPGDERRAPRRYAMTVPAARRDLDMRFSSDIAPADGRVTALIAGVTATAGAAMAVTLPSVVHAVSADPRRVASMVALTLALQLFAVPVYGRGGFGVSAIGVLATAFLVNTGSAIAVAAIGAQPQRARQGNLRRRQLRACRRRRRSHLPRSRRRLAAPGGHAGRTRVRRTEQRPRLPRDEHRGARRHPRRLARALPLGALVFPLLRSARARRGVVLPDHGRQGARRVHASARADDALRAPLPRAHRGGRRRGARGEPAHAARAPRHDRGALPQHGGEGSLHGRP